MFTTLLSFLGGSVFRMIWGEVSAWMTSRQDHQHELARLSLQESIDAAAHARNTESMRLAHELGIKEIRVQGDIDLSRLDADIFAQGVELTGQQTGIKFVDAWNAVIRPLLATVCMALIVLHFYRNGWVLDDRGWELTGAALGIFVADRVLFRRGK